MQLRLPLGVGLEGHVVAGAGDVLVNNPLGGAVAGDRGQGSVDLVEKVRVLLGNRDGVVLYCIFGVQDFQGDGLLPAGSQAQNQDQRQKQRSKLLHN